jgi:phenylpropionate dioxygenase-like ring-hydroxylating dioxygenase large terminal subunit
MTIMATDVQAAERSAKSSVAHVTHAWYIVATSEELGAAPLSRKLYGTPLVVFRDASGAPGVLLDRCAHRNVPLSLGRVAGGHLECPYHGWLYDRGGDCRKIPGFCGQAELPRRAVPRYATREQDGYVWAYGVADVEPEGEPYTLPALGDARYTTVRRVVEAEATLHAVIENALDVPHTAFLHKGLFRGTGQTNRITAVITRAADRVTTEYLGEPRPSGLAARILSPSGGMVTHYDRFILPSIAQVEYGIGDENHVLITSICTPLDDYLTRLYAIVSFRMRLPGWVIKPVLDPVAMKIFEQDARMLKVQTDAIKAFGGEHYTSTEIDLMGPQILRLLRRAEQRKPPKAGDEGWRREVTLEV